MGSCALTPSAHLVIVIVAVEEGLLPEDHTGQHAAQTPHVQAVVIHLEKPRGERWEAAAAPGTPSQLPLAPESDHAPPCSTTNHKEISLWQRTGAVSLADSSSSKMPLAQGPQSLVHRPGFHLHFMFSLLPPSFLLPEEPTQRCCTRLYSLLHLPSPLTHPLSMASSWPGPLPSIHGTDSSLVPQSLFSLRIRPNLLTCNIPS